MGRGRCLRIRHVVISRKFLEADRVGNGRDVREGDVENRLAEDQSSKRTSGLRRDLSETGWGGRGEKEGEDLQTIVKTYSFDIYDIYVQVLPPSFWDHERKNEWTRCDPLTPAQSWNEQSWNDPTKNTKRTLPRIVFCTCACPQLLGHPVQ